MALYEGCEAAKMKRRVAYIYDEHLSKVLDKIDLIRKRSAMVHELVFSYGLDSLMALSSLEPASEEELVSFHCSDYINFLKTANTAKDLEKLGHIETEFGLGYDCPLVDRIYDFVRAVAGGSLTAAKILTKKEADVAINWCGGWHHAQRDEAAGFCYVNDVVCAIHKLLETYERVLYIDLDVHHGDGVENAFNFTKKVMTLSLHKYEVGFYPGSGSLTEVGKGNGRYYSVNIPLKDGINDVSYVKIFHRVVSAIKEAYRPDAIVVQCGADSLTGDPLGTFNLTLKGFGQCVEEILSWEKPSLFLGGGGYNLPNTARCWTYLTSLIVDHPIPTEIPDNMYFSRYGPDFDLEITASNRKDSNLIEDMEECINFVTGNLQQIPQVQ